MAFTASDLERLETAIKSGVKSVQFGDRLTVYASLDEMLRARSAIAAELAGRPKQTLLVATKGL